MKKLLVLLVVFCVFSLASMAYATTFTLSVLELQGLTKIATNTTSAAGAILNKYTSVPSGYGTILQGDVGFTATLQPEDPNPPGLDWYGWMQIGDNTSRDFDTPGYTEYAQTFCNDNDDYWDVKIYIKTSSESRESSYFSLAPYGKPGSCVGISLDISTMADLDKVESIGFYVRGEMDAATRTHGTNPSPGDAFHMSSSPIPEPTTLLLLGSGLLGIAGMARRRRKKS